MRRKMISIALLLIDMTIVATIPFLVLFIRFEGIVDIRYYNMLLGTVPVIIIVRLSTFYIFGLYNRLWRYASINELLTICGAVTVSSLILFAYTYVIESKLPRSIHVLSWLFNIGFIGASRLVLRMTYYFRQKRVEQAAKVLIVGAGDAGAMIAREINHRYYETKQLVGFIDDDQYKNKQRLFGVKVLGNRQDIKKIVNEHGIDEIIIAMPSAGGTIIREIIHECKKTKCSLKILPGIYELIDGDVTVQQLRNVEVEDLLGRDPVKLDVEQIASYLKGKRVLVTGAGGSIGSELCRQIAKMGPNSLTLLGKGENSIYEIHSELKEKFKALAIEPIIADVRDKERIHTIFSQVKPQVVFHAAAHKHVPLMEAQPMEAVRNNIFGTKTVAEAADEFGAEAFVMISTDKAVNPTSVMGATKRVAELIIQNLSKKSDTKFVAVRFGNVLGSRGSVIPLFKKQIAKGGPVTITHPDMQRYFMTIPEASQLVLQAGAIAKGGEVFVLDMGEPVKIVDMACDLIELSGLVPHKDIKIEFSGLRPGEKLFEELLTAEEGTASTKHEKIFVANLKAVDEEKLQRRLMTLKAIKHSDEVIQTLEALLPTYQCSREKNCYIDAKIGVESHPMDRIVQCQTVSDLS
jgi:FlaA1/EpsC-like NDP-sugar epimerase